MRHLTILEHGSFLGIHSERLLVRQGDEKKEIPLNRIRSVTIAKGGVSCSATFLIKCALYGIRVFFLDKRRKLVVSLSGVAQQAVVELRRQQFRYIDSDESIRTMINLVRAKIRNQRAVLLYFSKYLSKQDAEAALKLKITSEKLMQLAKEAQSAPRPSREVLRNSLMGYEGQAAAIYWEALRSSGLMPTGFERRTGRGATEISNQALNLGYAILQTYVWNALLNAGLEVYAGFLHSDRPGKPSLVLDMMEEYRPWVVDRNIVKLRSKLEKEESLTPALNREVVFAVHLTFAKRYYFKGKRLKLETILQRQIYRLCGEFSGNKNYKPYLFKW